MIDFQFKNTLAIFAPSEVHAHSENATIIICGSSRGGTSFAAYALFNMGLFIGERIGVLNYEDQDLLAVLGNREEFLRIAALRDVRHARWGFKIPAAVQHVDWMASKLRNPIFVVVYRNPLGIAQSILKRDPNAKKELMSSISHGLSYMQSVTSGLFRTEAPGVLVDFEKARSDPATFLAEIGDVLSLPVTESRIRHISEEIAKGNYSASPRREGVLFV